ncbi:MAG: hypothetical protein KatS3mg102_2183 [Planctomycetota bacterium]|nr:MAG: hypothetical protein KatS3mg102_2183 [Planctomycetota bacterium]
MGERVAQLIVVEGPDRGRTFELRGRVVLGSGPDADLRLSDRRAAPRQAEIVADGERYEIHNLDLRKNLLVNGEVVRRGRLAHGDWISVADTTLVFSEETPPERQPLELPQLEAEELLRSQIAARRSAFDSADSVIDSFDSDPDASGLGLLQRARDRLATLYRVATAVSSELNLQRLLDRILELCFEVFDADRGFIMLMDEDDRRLKPVATRVRKETGQDGADIEFSRSIIRTVFRSREAVLSTDVERDRRFEVAASLGGGRMRSVLCAPLIREDRVLGVIHLDTRARSRAFTRGGSGPAVGDRHAVRDRDRERAGIQAAPGVQPQPDLPGARDAEIEQPPRPRSHLPRDGQGGVRAGGGDQGFAAHAAGVRGTGAAGLRGGDGTGAGAGAVAPAGRAPVCRARDRDRRTDAGGAGGVSCRRNSVDRRCRGRAMRASRS